MVSGRDAAKPIKDCPFCRVPPAKRDESFLEHPRCGACGILMGPGHVEEIAEYCTTCSRTRQREAALR